MPPTTMKKPAEKPAPIKAADAPPTAPPAPPDPPASAQQPTPPGPLESYGPDYAALSAQMADLNGQLSATTADAKNLAAEVGDLGNAPPVRLEALELLGAEQPGRAADLAAKVERLRVARHRVSVITEAIRLLAPRVEAERSKAWHALMRAAFPAVADLLRTHARDVAMARKSRMAVLAYMAAVEARAPGTQGGLGDMTFTKLGDPACHASSGSLFFADLITAGVLSGDEDYLAGVPLVVRRPDGSVVDRPAPPRTYNAPPQKPAGPSMLGAAAAAVGRAASAVAGLVGGRRSGADPAADALPTLGIEGGPMTATPAPNRTFLGGPKASTEPNAKTIRLLKDMATDANEWSAGWIGPWAAADATRMVKAGIAEWADAPAADAGQSPATAVGA